MMTKIEAPIVDCPHRVECGACSLLRQPYEEQLQRKQRWLMEALDEGIRYDSRQVLSTLPSPQVKGYRNRAKMTISSDRDRRYHLGYFQRRSREVIDAPECGILVPEILDTTQRLRRFLNSKAQFPFNLRHVDVRCGSDPTCQHMTLVIKSETMPRLPIDAFAQACPQVTGIAVNLNPKGGPQVIKGRIEPVAGDREIFVESGGMELRVSPGSFFQVNLGLLPKIHERMEAFLGTGNLLLDLYAGVGTHGLALRHRFSRVLCVEGVRSSVADARSSIKRARVDNVEIVANPIHRALRRLRTEKPNAVVLNPSRVGAESLALEAIIASPTRRLAYLSCAPTTLTRDMAMLIKGGFKLDTVQPIDMMPQTRQVEALAFLQR